jgi:hypothetical protein
MICPNHLLNANFFYVSPAGKSLKMALEPKNIPYLIAFLQNSLGLTFANPANPFTFALLIFRKTYGKP